jgi:hypothetical protein
MTTTLTLDTVADAPAWHDHGSHDHGLDTIAGYVVAITRLMGDVTTRHIARTDVEVFDGSTSYAQALDRARNERKAIARGEHGPDATYAVVDTVYTCGCRNR